MIMGPDELIRIAHAARRYYLQDRSRVDIAAELGVSRFKVARMLEKARELAIVTIDVQLPDAIDPELSIGLKNEFGLVHSIAVTSPSQTPEAIRQALGEATATLLQEIVTPADTLGFTAGRTLDEATKLLVDLPHCDVVALGGIAGPVREHGIEIVRRVARASGGESYPIFAPLLVQDDATAEALKADPLIRDAYSRFGQVTKGVVAIGSWNPPDSQLYDSANQGAIAQELVDRGVVGEVVATLYDRNGTVDSTLDHRSLAITADELRRVPEVIGVAGGATKVEAIRAALLGGLITSLITDTVTARALLDAS
ncbi:sugar-binding transcriptional regulator [Microbacterium halotolerans]|uniref:sugar-binding transcriptional regulator n=1 Tax=Microbacterium halotolerans TaxID=246613 RepID=UPI0013C346BD|nr:sugar-binding domain-containing protein [Microbacterium halotolerans]